MIMMMFVTKENGLEIKVASDGQLRYSILKADYL